MAETVKATTKMIPKSSLLGEIEVEVMIKSSADKFYNVYVGRPDHVAKASPSNVQACDLLEGAWGNVGSIVNWNYVYDGKTKVAKERIEVVEPEKKLIIEGDILAAFKKFVMTIQVSDLKEESEVGSLVKWHIEYEKIDDDVVNPQKFLPFLTNIHQFLGSFLISAPVTPSASFLVAALSDGNFPLAPLQKHCSQNETIIRTPQIKLYDVSCWS